MNSIINFFKGRKTYILAGAAALVLALGHFNVIGASTDAFLLKLCGAGAVASLRAAIAKLNAILPPQ